MLAPNERRNKVLDLRHWREVADEPSAEGGIILTEVELWGFIDEIERLQSENRRCRRNLREAKGYARALVGTLGDVE